MDTPVRITSIVALPWVELLPAVALSAGLLHVAGVTVLESEIFPGGDVARHSQIAGAFDDPVWLHGRTKERGLGGQAGSMPVCGN